MLRLERITKDNLQLALKVFHSIFTWMLPEVNPYGESLEPDSKAKYFIVYDEEKLVGLTGFYTVPEDPESAWLGWFGVAPEMRRCHYGSQILALHEESIRKSGYKYSRLYTEVQNNEATRHFYEKCGYQGELYDNAEEPELLKGLFMTYSKPLGDWPPVPWDSRFLRIYESEKGLYTEEQLAHADELIKRSTAAPHS